MLYFILFMSGVFFLTPIAYTFLRLANKIGPETPEDAAVLGIVLWTFCTIVGAIFAASAYDIWQSLPK